MIGSFLLQKTMQKPKNVIITLNMRSHSDFSPGTQHAAPLAGLNMRSHSDYSPGTQHAAPLAGPVVGPPVRPGAQRAVSLAEPQVRPGTQHAAPLAGPEVRPAMQRAAPLAKPVVRPGTQRDAPLAEPAVRPGTQRAASLAVPAVPYTSLSSCAKPCWYDPTMFSFVYNFGSQGRKKKTQVRTKCNVVNRPSNAVRAARASCSARGPHSIGRTIRNVTFGLNLRFFLPSLAF